jgi:c-di-GMP-binding flagellar brake protein YcgR
VSTPDHTAKTDLFSPDGKGDYWLRSRKEILAVLTDLGRKPTTITAYLPGNRDFILTAVLGLLPSRDLLVLDQGRSDALNDRLLEGGRAVCVAVHDHIRTRFDCAGAQAARFKGRGAFVCPIPARLYYRQRREWFRVATSVLDPPVCRVPQPGGGAPVELLVVDIGVGGVGLHDLARRLPLDPGAPRRLENCLLCLPAFGELSVDLQIRYHQPVTRKDGQEAVRVGAMFVGLRPGGARLLQQYVNRIQLGQLLLARE